MLVYLLGFTFSCFILWAVDHWKTESIGFVFWSIIALLIPCLIAGCRDSSIGTDVEVYATNMLGAADRYHSFADFWNGVYFHNYRYREVSELEIGYVALVWVAAKTADTLPTLLFLTQALTVVPIYLGLLPFRKSTPAWLGMAVYYLLYFNQSLNIMRQWIAMAVLFFGFHYLVEGRRVKYLVTVFVAFLFHTSALLGILVLLGYLFVTDELRGTLTHRVVLLIVFSVCVLGGLALVSRVLSAVGLSYYANYLGDYEVELMLNQLVLRLPVLLLLLINWPKLKNDVPAAGFFVAMACMGMVASQLGSVGSNSTRIGLYFSEYAVLSLPSTLVGIDKRDISRLLNTLAILGYSLLYWYVVYVYQGASETIPYVLGI